MQVPSLTQTRIDLHLFNSQDKYVSTLLAGYTVWPLVHVINFRFIPSSQRVLYINCIQASVSPEPPLPLFCTIWQGPVHRACSSLAPRLFVILCGDVANPFSSAVCHCAQVLWNTILCKIATNKTTEIVLEPNPHLENHPQPASS